MRRRCGNSACACAARPLCCACAVPHRGCQSAARVHGARPRALHALVVQTARAQGMHKALSLPRARATHDAFRQTMLACVLRRAAAHMLLRTCGPARSTEPAHAATARAVACTVCLGVRVSSVCECEAPLGVTNSPSALIWGPGTYRGNVSCDAPVFACFQLWG